MTWLLAATIKGSLLLALVLLLYHVARNRVPSRWLCVLLLVGIARVLLPVAPQASFSAFNLIPADPVRPLVVVVDEVPRAAAGDVRVAPRKTPVEAQPGQTFFLYLWLTGVLLFAARVLVRTFTFGRRLRDATVISGGEVVRLVEGRVRVLETSAVTTPALHGWLRPALLLPQGFLTTFTGEQLRYVVLHELAHVRRGDVLVNWIVTAAQALHWFNPLVHLAAARLAEERELACDAIALAQVRDRERGAYGGTVLELLERLRPASAVPAVVGMSTDKRQLRRRIQMIATFRPQSRHSLWFAAAVAAIGLVTLTDARAGEHFTHVRRGVPVAEALSPAAEATIRSLEEKVSLEFNDSKLEDVLHAVSNSTGVAITFAEGALDDAARNARITLKGENIPAHLVLIETLSSLDLAVRFTDTGVLVEKIDGNVRIVRVGLGEPAPPRALAPGDAAEPQRIFVHRMKPGAVSEGEAADNITFHVEADGAAAGKRTVRFRDDETNGTLEIEVVKQ